MDESCFRFNAECARRLGPRRRVCEFGSYNVNGSVRSLFQGTYVGIDVRPGPEVDMVADAKEYGEDESFDLVICNSVLEHEAEPWRVIENAIRILSPDGVLILCAPLVGYPKHGVDGGALVEEWYSEIKHDELIDWLAPLNCEIKVEAGQALVIAAKGEIPGDKPLIPSGGWCTCQVCNRVLYVEHGPVCVDCLRGEDGRTG